MATCERCNVADKPARRRAVEKPVGFGEGRAEVERVLCDDCAEVTGWSYPVRDLEEPPEAPEAAQDAAQEAPAPKGRHRAVHAEGRYGQPLCGQPTGHLAAREEEEITCRRCLTKLKGGG